MKCCDVCDEDIISHIYDCNLGWMFFSGFIQCCHVWKCICRSPRKTRKQTIHSKEIDAFWGNNNKVYLGCLSNSEYATDSIFNEYGLHGSVYAVNSIWNTVSIYGSSYSQYSSWNRYASNPPVIVD